MMRKKTAYTLMELLLVVALLAVVAAITMPTFYMSGTEKIVQARLSMFKARFTSIRTAIDLQLKDQAVLATPYHVTGTGAVSPIRRLVESGHLQSGSTKFENNAGKELNFEIRPVVGSQVEAQLPPILRTAALHVFIEGGAYDIDHALKVDQKSWQQIWEDIN